MLKDAVLRGGTLPSCSRFIDLLDLEEATPREKMKMRGQFPEMSPCPQKGIQNFLNRIGPFQGGFRASAKGWGL